MTAAAAELTPEIAAYLAAVREHEARLRQARLEAEAELRRAAAQPPAADVRTLER